MPRPKSALSPMRTTLREVPRVPPPGATVTSLGTTAGITSASANATAARYVVRLVIGPPLGRMTQTWRRSLRSREVAQGPTAGVYVRSAGLDVLRGVFRELRWLIVGAGARHKRRLGGPSSVA